MVQKNCPPLPHLFGSFSFKVSDPNLLLEPPRLLDFQFLWEKSVKESRCYVQKILTEMCKQYFDMQRDLIKTPCLFGVSLKPPTTDPLTTYNLPTDPPTDYH